MGSQIANNLIAGWLGVDLGYGVSQGLTICLKVSQTSCLLDK